MSSSIYKRAVKPNTFLHHYFEYMSPTETPLAYDFWCGMWLISNAVGRATVVARPGAPIFLNLYLVLCADAGTTRKSSAVRACEVVFRSAGFDKDTICVTGSITPESLIERLADGYRVKQTGNVSFIVSELVTLLGRDGYTMGLPGLLTDIYDCPAERIHSRLVGGDKLVRQIYPTFLAASTPSWLLRAINPDVIEGGFTSRCLFIIEEQRKKLVPWPEQSIRSEPSTLAERLLHIRQRASKVVGTGIAISDAAKAKFMRWYKSRDDADKRNAFVASFAAREDHHVLRLAALLCVNDDGWIIQASHIQHAINIINHCRDRAAHLFGEQRVVNKLSTGLDKLRSVLINAGELGISKSELIFKTRQHLAKIELDAMLGVLLELKMAQQFDIRTTGRMKTVFRGTSRLLAKDGSRKVLERLLND